MPLADQPLEFSRERFASGQAIEHRKVRGCQQRNEKPRDEEPGERSHDARSRFREDQPQRPGRRGHTESNGRDQIKQTQGIPDQDRRVCSRPLLVCQLRDRNSSETDQNVAPAGNRGEGCRQTAYPIQDQEHDAKCANDVYTDEHGQRDSSQSLEQ